MKNRLLFSIKTFILVIVLICYATFIEWWFWILFGRKSALKGLIESELDKLTDAIDQLPEKKKGAQS